MKTIAFAAAIVAATVAVSASATPAFAQPEGRYGSAKVTYDASTDRYCFRETMTGSIIPVTQCRSKSEWAQNGLTINHSKSAVQLARR
ncbi:hypothetical protein ASE85_17950 [Sphingobium sp. Leaf26]|uniref:hypothetical protein n=1 Tax=Sphingobium sp. Leaf26 TaxID=1735693 RepID=UPI0006F8F215|nr:hypothetical protein [Sphingobium sp. Leaf26]KQN07486.1 hypothetical protein ASE85_17950 [Sphingobium sp. Leaf26]